MRIVRTKKMLIWIVVIEYSAEDKPTVKLNSQLQIMK